jgi:chromosome segregation ATPase
MSETRTGDLSGGRSFEERVFARFDAIDARFNAMEARFEARFDQVEARLDRVEGRIDSLDSRIQALEAKALDTKPIWERALAEILNIKERVTKLERHFEVLAIEMVKLRGEQREINLRLDNLESKSA